MREALEASTSRLDGELSLRQEILIQALEQSGEALDKRFQRGSSAVLGHIERLDTTLSQGEASLRRR